VKTFGNETFGVWPILMLEELLLIGNAVVLGELLNTFRAAAAAVVDGNDDGINTSSSFSANNSTTAAPLFAYDKTLSWVFGVLLVVMTAVLGLTHHEYYFVSWRLGLHVRAAVTGVVFRKALRLNLSAFQSATNGQIINLVSSDVERLAQVVMFTHAIWTVPTLVPIIVGLIWRYVNWVSLLGIVVLAVLIPTQIFLGRALGRLRGQTAELTDKRVKRTEQMIAANRIMKM
jgi:ABC-type multidrug transport system fused ATPase/permease subunit